MVIGIRRIPHSGRRHDLHKGGDSQHDGAWNRDTAKRLVRNFSVIGAWFATSLSDLWPAVQEETDDGRTVLRLKVGSTLLALESALATPNMNW